MEKEKLNKKQITALVIGVLTMIILVSSATYAYFRVSIGNTATSTTITGDIGGGTLGTITLDGGGSELYLGVSAYDMSESKKGTTYYSSTTEGSRETNLANAGKATYTATLSGDESDSVMYACDYEFTITSTGTALESENISNISVVFEGDIKKTLPLSASGTVSGTWYGFKKSNAERSFNAYLQLSNTNSSQNSLAGTNLSVEIENTKWKCYLSELDELVGDAYAVVTGYYDEEWDHDVYNLIFKRSETPLKVGDTYNGDEIKKVYAGIEDSNSALWEEYNEYIINVTFEDKIRPINTANWFSYMYEIDLSKIDFSKLDTTLVTDMSWMFAGTYSFDDLDLSGWNTVNVTDMSSMFDSTGVFDNTGLDSVTLNLSGWDTSKVTDMSSMFSNYAEGESFDVVGLENFDVSNVINMSYMFMETTLNNIDLSRWDTSNVVNMSEMFEYSSINTDLGISSWNTGNVTDMSYMFSYAIVKTNIDLSGWDTSSVTLYEGFSDDVGGTGTLTPPTWKNLVFGVYSTDDYSLRLYNDLNIPAKGTQYRGKTVTNIYNMSNFLSSNICSTNVVPTQIVVEDNIMVPTYAEGWFGGCTKVNYIDVSKLDTSGAFIINEMFANVGSDASVTSMTLIGIDEFDTSKVTDMQAMFLNFGLNATYTLDLSGWDVSKVKYHTNFNNGVTTKVIAPNWKY